jgi:hypothetical protein
MTRDELVEELLPITRDFINQKRLSDAGCRTMLRILLIKIELSKLHQPTVSGAVCEHQNTSIKPTWQVGSSTKVCDDCGKEL